MIWSNLRRMMNVSRVYGPPPRSRHSEFNASQAPGLSNTRYNPKISPKTVFSKTLSQSAFPAKNSLVALKVDVVETG